MLGHSATNQHSSHFHLLPSGSLIHWMFSFHPRCRARTAIAIMEQWGKGEGWRLKRGGGGAERRSRISSSSHLSDGHVHSSLPATLLVRHTVAQLASLLSAVWLDSRSERRVEAAGQQQMFCCLTAGTVSDLHYNRPNDRYVYSNISRCQCIVTCSDSLFEVQRILRFDCVINLSRDYDNYERY